MILFVPVLPWLGTEICWLILKSRRPLTRLIAYLVCTAAILALGSWLIGIAYERYFETQYAEHGHGKFPDRLASNMISRASQVPGQAAAERRNISREAG